MGVWAPSAGVEPAVFLWLRELRANKIELRSFDEGTDGSQADLHNSS